MEENTAQNGSSQKRHSGETADLLTRYIRHANKNRYALLNKGNEDHQSAHFTSGLFCRQLADALERRSKSRPDGPGNEIIRNYRAEAQDHFRSAGYPSGMPPKGLAGMDYQERRNFVERNKKFFEMQERRRMFMDEVTQLRGRLAHDETKDPRTLAKLHSGIRDRLLFSTFLTNEIGDSGKGRAPKTEELIRQADEHAKKSEEYNKKAREITERTRAARKIQSQKKYGRGLRK